ncbi:hypothetical protein BCR35DRAFT_322707 [Leucosporidium creatinivorum]|uniref:Uncharacterized protein n=1 Tax=Leucosporidium creatinivorum TaxID=106004 RepID=A0A1Y2D7S0_9BASI|nr:hypothetical protein BCR35DRAFT_322707 [Leucosporidium creatinivorum]
MAQKHPIKVVIVGAGLSGITLGIELQRRGIDSFTLYEKNAEDVGGTWRDNTYPNCACDVPSHWYSLSTELNPDWTSKYSSQPEIQRYWKKVADKHRIKEHAIFNRTFVKATWVVERQGYHCEFASAEGETFAVDCDVLISCIGGFSTPLDRPHGMKGIERFQGPVFHSARWRYDVDLKGKRVGVIGNGCSAAQFVPAISADKTTEVLNFSRTPSWFAPRDQKDYSTLTKAAFRYIPGFMRSYRNWIAVTSDSRFIVWMLQFSALRHYVEEWSASYIRSQSPPKYHKFLVPKYPFGCKRVIMDPGYLNSLWRSNVELITDPISTITEKGLLGKSGQEYEFDVLILGTGFDVSEVGLGINVVGRDGKTVTEQWQAQGGPQAYLGTTISNFPSFYTILGPNVASGSASVVYSTEAQVNYIGKMLQAQVDYGVSSFECKQEAEKQYNEYIQGRLEQTVWNGGCTSYYKLGSKVIATFPGTTTEFWWRTREPKFEDYHQEGGTARVAVRKRLVKTLKLLTVLGVLLAARRLGWRRIKTEILVFLLMRYQEIIGFVQQLRAAV